MLCFQVDWHLFLFLVIDSVSQPCKGLNSEREWIYSTFWENEFQRYNHPVKYLKGPVHKFKPSCLHFISVRLPLHVEASGCVIVPEGEQLFQLTNGQFHMYVYAGMCVWWWWWGCDEFDLCFLQPPQTASIIELLQPLWTSVSRREVRLWPEPRRL